MRISHLHCNTDSPIECCDLFQICFSKLFHFTSNLKQSGTTDVPKAAMLCQDAICYIVRLIGNDMTRLQPFNERFVSYLPLSHVAAQMTDIFASILVGATVFFAQPDALKGSLAQTIKEVRPTLFFGVPRIWEKMMEAIQKKAKTITGYKKSIRDFSRFMGSFYNGQFKLPIYLLSHV
jgi:long-chain-fatty-acid--CoA ligase ACSBG